MSFRIGLVGVGFMGRGIATCFLAHDFPVKVFDPKYTDSAAPEIESFLHELVEHQAADSSVLNRWRSNFHPVKSLDDFADCDFVIETVSENLPIKQQLFEQLEQIIRPDVPLASNTSAIPISLMQKSLKHPERVAGMHWMTPAHVSRFVEVIRGDQTSDATIDIIMNLARQIDKEPALLNRDIEGFLVNRLCYAMYREALFLLSHGYADAETIDRCWQHCVGSWSNIAGPFRWMDLTGTALYAAGMRRIFPTLCNDADVPPIMLKLESENAMGLASGRGFYKYTDAQAKQWAELLRQQTWATRKQQEHLP